MDLITNLMAAGFTAYEARVYQALLADYPATGYQLSVKAGIPRSMVYEALGRLHARGAVMRTEELRSTLYRPLPPDSVLDQIEHQQKSLLSNLRQSLHNRSIQAGEERLWTLNSSDAILGYARQMLQQANQEMMLVISDPDLEVLTSDLERGINSGCQVSLLLTGQARLEPEHPGSTELLQIAYHPPFESQLQDLLPLLVVVVDNQECLIGRAQGDSPNATVTRNRNLVYLARQFIWMEMFTQQRSSNLNPTARTNLNGEKPMGNQIAKQEIP